MPTEEGILGYTLFQNTENLDQGILGYTLFQNTENLDQGILGYTWFYDFYGIPNKQGTFGYTYFYNQKRFPPVDVSPPSSFVEIPIFRTTITNFGSKVEQRISDDVDVQYKYKIGWKILSQSEINTLINFFIARKGAFEAMTFYHPETGEQKVARFELDIAEIEHFMYLLYALHEITVIEVNEIII